MLSRQLANFPLLGLRNAGVTRFAPCQIGFQGGDKPRGPRHLWVTNELCRLMNETNGDKSNCGAVGDGRQGHEAEEHGRKVQRS